MDAGLREEVLKKYSDMLRVGELWLNDGLLKWSSTSEVAPEIALDELYRVFEQRVGDTPSVNAGVLLYLVCKSTSMDYILLHVLQFLREHIQSDMVPTITGSFGYHVGVAKTSCRVELRFSDRDNLVVTPRYAPGAANIIQEKLGLKKGTSFAVLEKSSTTKSAKSYPFVENAST